MKKEIKNEQGAIIIEAIISLTTYIFAIFLILSVVDICYTQARISMALNAAAKDISKYSYFYYKFGIDEMQAAIHDKAEGTREMADATLDGMGKLMDSFNETQQATDLDSLKQGVTNVINAGDETSEAVETIANAMADDPKGFLVGMGALAGDELGKEAQSLLAKVMAKAFMKKNLVAYEGDDVDAFLKRHGIEKGLAGLDFDGTIMMPSGKTDHIMLVVTYEIKVIELLDMDYSFKIKQTAQTKAWGNGAT